MSSELRCRVVRTVTHLFAVSLRKTEFENHNENNITQRKLNTHYYLRSPKFNGI